MNKITSLHLNGKAYQLEEAAYDLLREYLARAEMQLAENPDKTEILADLEQAIAEKSGAFLNPAKDVLTTSEIASIIKEMGPVDGEPSQESSGEQQKKKEEETSVPKRLYLIREGAFFGGVCTGLSAYLALDVTVVRVSFIMLTVLTGGAWLLVYAALMFVVPYAITTEERAQAHGEVFTAQEVINRAKESYARFTSKEEWKNRDYAKEATEKAAAFRDRFEARAHARWNKNTHRFQGVSMRPAPFLGFISMVLAVLWIAALISLIQTGAIFGWMVTAYVPLWAAIVLLFIVYHAVTGPMRAARWIQVGNQWQPTEYAYDAWHGISDGLGVLFLVICAWFAYTHVPAVHTFVNDLPEQFQRTMQAIRQK